MRERVTKFGRGALVGSIAGLLTGILLVLNGGL